MRHKRPLHGRRVMGFKTGICLSGARSCRMKEDKAFRIDTHTHTQVLLVLSLDSKVLVERYA